MPTSIQGVPPKAQPWARGVGERLDAVERSLGLVTTSVTNAPVIDKAVYAEFNSGQNISVGTSGRVEPSTAVAVRFTSSTGLFEVTVSLSGLVRDGAIFGASFESQELPYEVSYDIPRYGVAQSAPIGQTAWSPFSSSTSTIVTTRPGAQSLNLYLYAVCTAGANSAAYLKYARLSVKAV